MTQRRDMWRWRSATQRKRTGQVGGIVGDGLKIGGGLPVAGDCYWT
ncbi:hypothetical protein A2U01_0044757, partial [Trifolium medium]|nr:hypothetical protein [Trifolium medium]